MFNAYHTTPRPGVKKKGRNSYMNSLVTAPPD